MSEFGAGLAQGAGSRFGPSFQAATGMRRQEEEAQKNRDFQLMLQRMAEQASNRRFLQEDVREEERYARDVEQRGQEAKAHREFLTGERKAKEEFGATQAARARGADLAKEAKRIAADLIKTRAAGTRHKEQMDFNRESLEAEKQERADARAETEKTWRLKEQMGARAVLNDLFTAGQKALMDARGKPDQIQAMLMQAAIQSKLKEMPDQELVLKLGMTGAGEAEIRKMFATARRIGGGNLVSKMATALEAGDASEIEASASAAKILTDAMTKAGEVMQNPNSTAEQLRAAQVFFRKEMMRAQGELDRVASLGTTLGGLLKPGGDDTGPRPTEVSAAAAASRTGGDMDAAVAEYNRGEGSGYVYSDGTDLQLLPGEDEFPGVHEFYREFMMSQEDIDKVLRMATVAGVTPKGDKSPDAVRQAVKWGFDLYQRYKEIDGLGGLRELFEGRPALMKQPRNRELEGVDALLRTPREQLRR